MVYAKHHQHAPKKPHSAQTFSIGFLTFQMLEASLYISEHLPDGAKGLWAVVHCATWVALGELEWIPFAVLRKSIDVNLLGKLNAFKCKYATLNESINRNWANRF